MTGKRPISLPERRVSRCERVSTPEGRTFFVHCGFDWDGKVREIFVDCRQASSEMARMLADQAIGLSYRMQYGVRLAELTPRSETMQLILERAVAIERECAAEVIAEYQAAGLVAA